MRSRLFSLGAAATFVALFCSGCVINPDSERARADAACAELASKGLRPLADKREERFLGKVQPYTARCRGGDYAESMRATPWVDWANYWSAGDESTKFTGFYLTRHLGPNGRGIDGALLDLEYQRMELISFNLHDPNTYERYVTGAGDTQGAVLERWAEMRLPDTHPSFATVGGAAEQVCSGELIRHRTLTGICNDVFNPMMGSTGMVFARNVQFEETFPERGGSEEHRNRHGDRIGLLKPDPQVISRKLLTREQSEPGKCNAGLGVAGNSPDGHCDYQKAPFFNVLAAFWIQFMTHDWFGHLQEGLNGKTDMKVGCETQLVDNVEKPLSDDDAKRLGCRKGDRMASALMADTSAPGRFSHGGREYMKRPPATTRNNVTAWWDASQIYGYDETSRKRVKRDPADSAKLLLRPVGNRPGAGEQQGYLPLLATCEGAAAGCRPDPMNPLWKGQEATAFPDNWTIGMSFYHNVFAREHNAFVSEFRRRTVATPDADSGLRDPTQPARVIRYSEVTNDELFEAGRLVVSALIAKIHTIEWTTQLLYDEPLFRGMNANWGGLVEGNELAEKALEKVVERLRESIDPRKANQLYSAFAAGPGIVGTGSKAYTDISDAKGVNGGVNHFGSPFNFPEEFITVYRLHPLLPDLIEYRDWNKPNEIVKAIPIVSTFRAPATEAMRSGGLANFALSMGRQRLGALTLRNHPAFLQNVPMPHLASETKMIDVAALDLIRDRERGVPRFNEFRRQYGLTSLRSFDDFLDVRRNVTPETKKRQQELVASLREVYGRHRCDDSKVITHSQLMNGKPITDCLGHPNGTMVDNVEDLDTIVGWLSEFVRPHGFAISETQFVVFILNASRRLYSDRFFTSSFRPEFYTQLGYDWVNDNGPDGTVMERGKPNGTAIEMAPMKRVLLRAIPELKPELDHVVNVFDPWARDRGTYYSLEWKPREDARSDPAFATSR
jgi:hypothetical protein